MPQNATEADDEPNPVPPAVDTLSERDLPEAERIFRIAFGTFLGVPEPETVASLYKPCVAALALGFILLTSCTAPTSYATQFQSIEFPKAIGVAKGKDRITTFKTMMVTDIFDER